MYEEKSVLLLKLLVNYREETADTMLAEGACGPPDRTNA
jgi:hypothetical protein